ncbi:MAG: SDR family NAD(P)-dependent oxidoreductase [Ignavibacteriae bacterium]|nr:SDR family NAD(P)-dependent oxidoreductase [Ignavibacteriota bacterium]
MNILVTGGAGFIGSNIADRYIKEGHKVIIADNLSTGYLRNINTKAVFYKTDISGSKLEDIFKKHRIDVINHHAAQVDLRFSFDFPVEDAKINIEGTINLLQLAVKYKVKKIIFASSGGAIYGEQDYFPAGENHPKNPLSPYGITKLAVENYLGFYHRNYGLNYVCLRYSNVYGPRQLPKGDAGVVAVFCKKIIRKQQPLINGSGKNTRDFVFIEDVVNANYKALNCKKSLVVNIGTGVETQIIKVFRLINKYFGNKVKEKHGKPVKGEQKRSLLDNTLAVKSLKWKPKISIEEGLALTCRYFEHTK